MTTNTLPGFYLRRSRLPMGVSPEAGLRQLVLRAAEPGISPAERAAKARTAGSELADLRDLVSAAGVLPGRVADSILAARGDEAASERAAAHDVIAEALGAIESRGNFPGLIAASELATKATGLGDGLPLVRQISTSWPWSRGTHPLIPGVPTGVITGEVFAPDATIDTPAAAPLTISRPATPPSWSIGVVRAEISKQVFDFTDSDSHRFLDQVLNDIADGAAETNICAQLIAAGTNAAVSAGDVAGALDAAEGFAGATLLAPAGIVLANPADLPKVRRAVAASWQVDPHPTLYGSMGVTAGKVIVTGANAFTLLTRPVTVDAESESGINDPSQISTVRPRGWSMSVVVMRNFILVIRKAAGIRVVTL